jgi:preprotein translocase subunit SecB
MADNEENNNGSNENEESTEAVAAPQQGATAQAQGARFALQRLYLKDCSFESPRSPLVFQGAWEPKINFDIKTRNAKIQDDTYEVVLVLTAEAKLEDQSAFLVEIHQAGIFTCREFDEEQMEQVLSTVCPNILFPYAREAIDSLVVKGSFPALMLAPINFDALYAQQKQAQADQAAAAENGNGAATDEAAPETTQ